MKKISSHYLNYYDKEVVNYINEKYNIPYMTAFIEFINSETYKMLEDEECAMYEFGSPAIFNLWEVERITGEPRNSVYIRSE